LTFPGEIFVALTPVDMQWSFERLTCYVEGQLGRRAQSRALFMFFGKRRDALKLLFFDGTGLCVGERSGSVWSRRSGCRSRI